MPTPEGCVLFDETVLDKNYSRKIEPARRPWSSTAKRIIEAIGVVTGVYLNPKLDRFWVIDYRIYAPETDGKTKLDEMLLHPVEDKQRAFETVLMDVGLDAAVEAHRGKTYALSRPSVCSVSVQLMAPSALPG